MNIIAQLFGIAGMACSISSFQCKKNRILFFLQATSGLMFGINFLMIGALGSALFNIFNIVRGMLFSKSDRIVWKLMVILALYGSCTAVSLPSVWSDTFQMVLLLFTTAAQFVGTAAMWSGNGTIIRKAELFFVSPIWLINGCINFTLGGIVSSCFNMISIIVSFIRFGKHSFEK